MSQYQGSFDTDSCVSGACQAALGAPSSLTQGDQFAALTKDFHGGAKKNGRKNRKMNTRKNNRRNMRGGAAEYPSQFSQLLPNEMHASADVGRQDAAFAQLPEFVGKYGMSGGRRRSRRMHGGIAPINAPAMILTPQEEPAAFLNPQWYTENQVVPSFKGPENAYAVAQYAQQSSYQQKAGRRNSRKANRKNRKASRKANRKNRKASRKASRKNRKASRKNRKASRKNRKDRK